jgi:hypothetical protein
MIIAKHDWCQLQRLHQAGQFSLIFAMVASSTMMGVGLISTSKVLKMLKIVEKLLISNDVSLLLATDSDKVNVVLNTCTYLVFIYIIIVIILTFA